MNNTINKIKLFLKGKPARIVIALLVIAAIMTGVAFGIMAIIGAFKDPCQSGYYYDNNLKVCVKDSCEINGEEGFVCKNKKTAGINKCIPKNYCDYSNEEGSYYYDHETCECKLDCSSLPESNAEDFKGFTRDGNNSTMMKPDPNNPNSYIPEDNLYCGKSCDFNKTNNTGIGGYEWCPPSYLCGTSINSDGINLSPNVGCFPDNGTYEQCGNSNNICKYGKCDSNDRCKVEYCNGSNAEGNKLYYSCINDKDCVRNGTSLSEGVCLTGSAAESESGNKKFKYFTQVGFCKDNNQYNDDYCTTLDMIGEKNKDGNFGRISCDNYHCKDCTKIEGVSGQYNPCDNNTTIDNTYNSCAKHGICDNNWQVKDISGNTSCFEGNPPDNIDITCCPTENIATIPGTGHNYCCPIKALPDNQGNKGNKVCSLNTEFGYSERHLTQNSNIELSKTIPCITDSDCEKYNPDLWKNLGINSDDATNPKKSTYSRMYCADDPNPKNTGKKVCKATCGLFDVPGKELNSKIGVLNNVSNSTSFCFPKNQECQIGGIPQFGGKVMGKNFNPSVNSIPICSKDGLPDAWTSTETGYLTGGFATLKTPKGGNCNSNMSEQTCLNALGKNDYQINDINVVKGGCEFIAACDQLPVAYETVNNGTKEIKSIPWSNLLKDPNTKNLPFNDKIAQSPKKNLSKEGTVKLYYDKKEGCTGFTNGLDESITKSPVNYISATEQCSPRGGYTSKLQNEGIYCPNYVNPITNECITSNLQTEKFSNIDTRSDLNVIYGSIQDKTANDANITDGKNNYYCGSLGLKTGVDNDPKQIVTRKDDKAQIFLRCKDDVLKGRSATISCYDINGDSANCCQRNPWRSQDGKIIQTKTGWKCDNFNTDPNAQVDGLYLCTNDDGNTITKGNKTYKRVRTYTNEDAKTIPKENATSYPEVCDLRGLKVNTLGHHGHGGRQQTQSGKEDVCKLMNLGSPWTDDCIRTSDGYHGSDHNGILCGANVHNGTADFPNDYNIPGFPDKKCALYQISEVPLGVSVFTDVNKTPIITFDGTNRNAENLKGICKFGFTPKCNVNLYACGDDYPKVQEACSTVEL